MTLLSLGEVSGWQPWEVEALEQSLGAIWAAAFPVCFDRVRANGRQAALIGNTPMREARGFRRKLRESLPPCATDVFARQKLRLPTGNSRPHITLDYKTRNRCDELIPPIAWMVEEFLLIESIHGVGHRERGRWPLIPTLL